MRMKKRIGIFLPGDVFVRNKSFVRKINKNW